MVVSATAPSWWSCLQLRLSVLPAAHLACVISSSDRFVTLSAPLCNPSCTFSGPHIQLPMYDSTIPSSSHSVNCLTAIPPSLLPSRSGPQISLSVDVSFEDLHSSNAALICFE